MKSVAYFCAEYALSDRLPIYSGGLGVLAGDIVQEAAQQGLPFTAVGLFYRRGYFHQYSLEDGQHERTSETDPFKAGLSLVQREGDTLLVEVPYLSGTLFIQAWHLAVGGNSLYLLDTDHWRNPPEWRGLTDSLYGGDATYRLSQEVILGIGGARLLKALNITPEIYHINEGHAALLALEVAKESTVVFTNHTLVAAGNDVFDETLVRTVLASYQGLEKGIAIALVNGRFSMTQLALASAKRSNAVSKVHARQAKKIWPSYPLLPLTNGVFMPGWLAPEWQLLFDQQLPSWRDNLNTPKFWRSIRSLPVKDLWERHMVLKSQMLDEVFARSGIRLDALSCTVVWARRFATYKRPTLLFSDLERLKKLLFAENPIQVIIAGKSHPADVEGKELIRQVEHLANFDLKHRVVFVDDYSITLAKTLVAGADVWLNTPTFGLEASGTSGIKAAANGVLQCTVPDGWAAEVDWSGLGFNLSAKDTERSLYEVLEKRVLPAFNKRTKENIPEGWVKMMQESMGTIIPRFSTTRLLADYRTHLYR